MSDLQPSQYEFLTEHVNPRSCSGQVIDKNGRPEEILHYKRAQTRELLEHECTQIRRAETVGQSVPGIQSIRLRASLPDEHILIAEHVHHGQSLFNYLWNRTGLFSRLSFARLDPAEIGSRIGCWLKAYHSIPIAHQATSAELAKGIARACLERLKNVQLTKEWALSFQIHRDLTEFLVDVLENGLEFQSGNPCQIHGDFDPSNILVDEDQQLIIVDFADSRIGLGAEDVARVWHSLWAITQVSARRGRILKPLLESLLRGYADQSDLLRSPLFQLCRCWNGLTSLMMAFFLKSRTGFRTNRILARLAKVNHQWLESLAMPCRGRFAISQVRT